MVNPNRGFAAIAWRSPRRRYGEHDINSDCSLELLEYQTS